VIPGLNEINLLAELTLNRQLKKSTVCLACRSMSQSCGLALPKRLREGEAGRDVSV